MLVYIDNLTANQTKHMLKGHYNPKNSIRDARTPQPREIFLIPSDMEVLYQYKVQDTLRELSVI